MARSHFGSISTRKDRKGLYVRFTYQGHRVWRYAGPTKDAARMMLVEVEKALAKGLPYHEMLALVFKEGASERLRFNDAVDRYLESVERKLKASTLETRKVRLATVKREPWTHRFVDEIRNRDLVRWQQQMLDDGRAPATVNRYCSAVSQVFRWLQRNEYLSSNPVRDALERQSEKGSARCIHLSKEHAAHLIAAAPDDFRTILILANYAGLRRGEIRTLAWRDVALKEREIHLRGKNTKNRRPRTVPMADTVFGALTRLHKQRTKVDGEALVFPHPATGEPWTDTMYRRRWANTMASAKDLPDVLRETLRFHDQRHTFATLMVNRGQPLEVISELLGHSSVVVTQQHYAHLLPDRKHAAVRAIAALGV